MKALSLAAARQAAYASGYTLHFELCNDGIDNDNNPETPDDAGACAQCIPTLPDDPPNGIDDNCDGMVDNPVPCQPIQGPYCAPCATDQACATNLSCLVDNGASYCLPSCASGEDCPIQTTCEDGLCLPLATHHCAAYNTCSQSNGGVETCDGVDNDCNGIIDDIAVAGAEQLNEDAFCTLRLGVGSSTPAVCIDGNWICGLPTNYAEPVTLAPTHPARPQGCHDADAPSLLVLALLFPFIQAVVLVGKNGRF
jgi:hypothetical protein